MAASDRGCLSMADGGGQDSIYDQPGVCLPHLGIIDHAA